MRVPILTALIVLGGCGLSHAADMAAHRALYRLTMDPTRSGDIVAAAGTMGY